MGRSRIVRYSLGIFLSIFLILLSFSVFYTLSPVDNGQTMYVQTFVNIIREAPKLDMTWTHFKDDWLSNWDSSFLPGLRSFVGGLIEILQVFAIACGGVAQMCVYVFYYLQWLF